ncbi:MAG TPA: rhodanese-like domain-containing protein, partial [Flavobacteriia bacterium]|nr:rhodanese-like domain-containing protein [Flavobacteriia bacterium]
MKKIILLLAISIFFTSCGQTAKKEVNSNQKTAQQKAKIEKLDTKSFYERVNDHKVQLIDVRTPQEYASGHIKNA